MGIGVFDWFPSPRVACTKRKTATKVKTYQNDHFFAESRSTNASSGRTFERLKFHEATQAAVLQVSQAGLQVSTSVLEHLGPGCVFGK